MVARSPEAIERKRAADRARIAAKRLAARGDTTTVAPASRPAADSSGSPGSLRDGAITPALGSNSIALPLGRGSEEALVDRWDALLASSVPPLHRSDSGGSEAYRGEVARGFELIGLPKRGKPIYGHQLAIADVLNASTDEYGTPLHRFVGVLVARRAGKTASILATLLGRMEARPGYRVAMALATGGNMGLKTAIRDVFTPLEIAYPDKAARPFVLSRSAGNPHVRWSNGSHLAILPPSSAAARGEPFSCVWIDEGQFASPEMTEDLLAGFLSTMDTLDDGQFIVSGSAGEFRTGQLLHDALVAGREGEPGAGVIEWAAPESVTVDDIDEWEKARPIVAAAHPGFGGLSAEANVEANYRKLRAMPNGLTKFSREYLSQFGDVGMTAGLFKPEAIAALELDDEELPAPPERFALAIAVRPNQSASSIVAAWREADGTFRGLLLENREGVSWLAKRAAELSRKYRVPVSYDNLGPVLVEVEKLQRMTPRPRLDPSTSRQTYTAAAQLVDLIADRQLWHWGQEPLTRALELVRRRKVGEKAFALGGDPDDDISPAEALSYAVAAYDRMPAKRALPQMMAV